MNLKLKAAILSLVGILFIILLSNNSYAQSKKDLRKDIKQVGTQKNIDRKEIIKERRVEKKSIIIQDKTKVKRELKKETKQEIKTKIQQKNLPNKPRNKK